MPRQIPLQIGDFIPAESDHWNNFLLMLDIVDIIFAPTVDASLVAHLRTKIQEHHIEFKRIYPDASIIPKMHFMVHYPVLILRYNNYYSVHNWLICVCYVGMVH